MGQEHGSVSHDTAPAHAQESLRLALGPVAAFYEDTPYFVNQIENRGAWGYQAVRQLLEDMIAACAEEKSCEELVQRKGWGLPSLIENINRAPRGAPG